MEKQVQITKNGSFGQLYVQAENVEYRVLTAGSEDFLRAVGVNDANPNGVYACENLETALGNSNVERLTPTPDELSGILN